MTATTQPRTLTAEEEALLSRARRWRELARRGVLLGAEPLRLLGTAGLLEQGLRAGTLRHRRDAEASPLE